MSAEHREQAPTPAVAVEQFSFTYPGRTSPSLENINLQLAEASWTLLVGPTGSGKSTLLRAIAGLVPRHSSGTVAGRVLLWGRDTVQATRIELARTVGLVQQSPDDQICTSRVTAEVAFGLENLATPVALIEPIVADSLASVGLAELTNRSTAQLSGGQKQRLMLASILALGPRLLVLDEPLSRLDPAGALEVLELLEQQRRGGLSIVMVEHRLDDVLSRADRVVVLDRGAIVADLPATDPELADLLAPLGVEMPEVAQLARRLGHPGCSTAASFLTHYSPATARQAPAAAEHRGTEHAHTPIATLEDVSYRFRAEDADVLSGVSCQLFAGENVALVGPNGSGKSTLLALVAGLWRPTSGRVRVEEHDPAQAPLGLVLQNPDLMLFCPTVGEELAFGPRQSGQSLEVIARRVQRAADELSVAEFLDDNPLALSQGQRLRVAIAATRALGPQLLLLDEPTTGQDARQIERVMQAITAHDPGATHGLVFSTHDLRSVMRFADRVLVLVGGRLVFDGTPGQLIDNDELLAAASLRRPPLWEVRRALGLTSIDVDGLARELSR